MLGHWHAAHLYGCACCLLRERESVQLPSGALPDSALVSVADSLSCVPWNLVRMFKFTRQADTHLELPVSQQK